MYRGMGPSGVEREPLPDHQDLSLFVATLFQRLGGRLEIDGAGRRRARRSVVGDRRDDLPQLPQARAWERFRSCEEWEGAMKLAEYWLARLSDADREYVYTLLADTALDPETDFRERL